MTSLIMSVCRFNVTSDQVFVCACVGGSNNMKISVLGIGVNEQLGSSYGFSVTTLSRCT